MQVRHHKIQQERSIDNLLATRLTTHRVDVRIRDSWQRCISRYNLRPDEPRTHTFVSNSELRQRRTRSQELYAVAQIEMASLARLLNAPVGVMLTDADGVILSVVGTQGFAEIARSSGLSEGAVWSEAEQGTNGMGTCLVTRNPVIIQEDEHFLSQNSALTCCGAPILNGLGEVIGALNISGRLRLSAAPTLALVRLAVQNVENRVLLARHHQHHLLRFHPHPEFVCTAGEGIVALDSEGRIVAANHAALEWLGIADHSGLCGQAVERVFSLDPAHLAALGSDPASAKPLPQRDRGSMCYGVLQSAPQISSNKASPPCCPNALMQAEHKLLLQVVERCGWNVSLAATQLNVSRRTLHRKLRLHGLRRYSM